MHVTLSLDLFIFLHWVGFMSYWMVYIFSLVIFKDVPIHNIHIFIFAMKVYHIVFILLKVNYIYSSG